MTTTDPDTRTALLRQLARTGFAPADEAAAPWSADARAAAFAADVEALAAAFWTLPPADRRRRWLDLTACGFGAAATRLADLAPGLKVEPAAQPDPHAAELAALVRELFVLPPAARRARRVGWLQAPGRRDPEWVAAVRTVLRADPVLARLEPRLFDWYSLNLTPAPVPGAEVTPTPFLPADFGPLYSDPLVVSPGRTEYYDPPHAEPRKRPYPAPAPAAHAGGGSHGWWLGLIGVMVVIRLIAAAGKNTPSPPPPPRAPHLRPYQPTPALPEPDAPPADRYVPPEPPFPKGPHPMAGKVSTIFSREDVRLYREFERSPTTGPAPARYQLWVYTGRPEGYGP